MRRRQTHIIGLIASAIALSLLLPTWAHAALFVGDAAVRAGWEAAAPGFQPVDIGATLPANGDVLSAGDPLLLPFSETLTFDIDLDRRQVPDGGWATWSGGKTPVVLSTLAAGDANTLMGTFGPGPVQAFGLEIEPNVFGERNVTLTLMDGMGGTAFLSHLVDGEGGALFFGWTDLDVASMSILCVDCSGFAFAEMVKAEGGGGPVVPEPGTLLLIGSGLVGLGVGTRRRNRRQ